MYAKTILSSAIAVALALPGTASALEYGGVEASGYLRNITSVFTDRKSVV